MLEMSFIYFIVVRVVDRQRTLYWHSGFTCLMKQRVDVRQKLISELDVVSRYLFHFLPICPGFCIATVDHRVAAEERGEGADGYPPCKEFGISIANKTSHIIA